MSRRIPKAAIAAAAAFVAALLLAGPASAEIRKQTGLFDQRYCEIFEIKGIPPAATATIWNTIGLNECPAEWWDNLDTTKIAAENGDTLVVKNGPRHWVIDSAKGEVGGIKDFEGQKLRQVADLQQTPYTERTIERTNTWKWKKGRRIFELVDPKGVHYRMQSYSQIVDPELTLRDLPSLGKRLALPEGWRFRTQRLRKPLVMRAPGTATIIQDDLKNTYQRVVPKPSGKRRKVAVTGMTKLDSLTPDGRLNDRGTITGRPFGEGTIDILVRFEGQGRATADFTIATPEGTASAKADLTFEVSGGEIHFEGTADMVSGTGRFRKITGTDLPITDTNTLDGQNGRVTMDGFVRF
jgi:hypothetical protein